MRDLAREHGEALDLVLAGGERRERPLSAQLGGRDGEVRRLHDAGEHADGVGAAVLLGQHHGGLRVGAVGGGEERQPERVIPVQMAEQDRAGEGRAVEHAR